MYSHKLIDFLHKNNLTLFLCEPISNDLRYSLQFGKHVRLQKPLPRIIPIGIDKLSSILRTIKDESKVELLEAQLFIQDRIVQHTKIQLKGEVLRKGMDLTRATKALSSSLWLVSLQKQKIFYDSAINSTNSSLWEINLGIVRILFYIHYTISNIIHPLPVLSVGFPLNLISIRLKTSSSGVCSGALHSGRSLFLQSLIQNLISQCLEEYLADPSILRSHHGLDRQWADGRTRSSLCCWVGS